MGTPDSQNGAMPYEIIDGWAVHDGDMVLEPVGGADRVLPGPTLGAGPLRRNSATGYWTLLWPQGKIPYVIDEDFSAETKQDILAAIGEWNTKTVITLYPRTTEADYVRFRTTTERCRSNVGKIGGEQSIWWVQQGHRCGDVSFLLHEIGHTVGLWHEHQRTDRDEYLTVREDGVFETGVSWVVDKGHPAHGPYDFASVMHYHPLAHSRDGLPVLETIPPGIQIRSPDGGLSVGDVHRTAAIYERRLWPTTISSNPPGLNIMVNGKPFKTPATFFWPHGRIKSLRAPSPQEEKGNRYVFARWNDNRSREHNVTIGNDGTWFEANYIVQHSTSGTAYPESAGTVRFDPPSPDGYYTTRTEVNVFPVPRPGTGFKFWRWRLWRNHGLASDPAHILIMGPHQFAAHFTRERLFRIDSTVGPFLLNINGKSLVGPVALHQPEYGSHVRVSVPEVQPRPASTFTPIRYRFQGWTDGGPHARWVNVSKGGKLVAVFKTESDPNSGASGPSADRITAHSPSQGGDQYFATSSLGRAPAESNPGLSFARWRGDSTSTAHAEAVETDRARIPGAAAAQSGRIQTSVYLQRASLAHGRDGFRAPVQEHDEKLIRPGFRLVDSEGKKWILGPARTVPALDRSETAAFSTVPPGSPARITERMQVENETAALQTTGRLSPRALTFVAPSAADAPPQSVTLSNVGPGTMHYRFDTDTPWLRAEPGDGVLRPHDSVRVAIRTHSAGIVPDTYLRELKVRLSDEAGESMGDQTLQVALAVLPPPNSSQR